MGKQKTSLVGFAYKVSSWVVMAMYNGQKFKKKSYLIYVLD